MKKFSCTAQKLTNIGELVVPCTLPPLTDFWWFLNIVRDLCKTPPRTFPYTVKYSSRPWFNSQEAIWINWDLASSGICFGTTLTSLLMVGSDKHTPIQLHCNYDKLVLPSKLIKSNRTTGNIAVLYLPNIVLNSALSLSLPLWKKDDWKFKYILTHFHMFWYLQH